MSFLNFVMALSPIIVVLVGILGFHQSAKRVAPIALLWTLLLAFTYFNVTGATFKENVAVYDALIWKGIKEGLKIVLMVFGAFVILNILRDTGAIEEVKGAIALISDDRRVQVIVIGMMLPIFLEGAAGAGSPAAAALSCFFVGAVATARYVLYWSFFVGPLMLPHSTSSSSASYASSSEMPAS